MPGDQQESLRVYAGLTHAEAMIVVRQDADFAKGLGRTVPTPRLVSRPENLLGYADPATVYVCGQLGDWLHRFDTLRASGVKVRTRWT